MEILLGVVLFFLAAVVVILIWTQLRLSALSNQISNSQAYDTISKRIQEADQSNRESFERLAGTIGKLSQSTQQMMEIGKTITSLEDLLKPPKLRGGIGETLLGQLLAQILPQGYFELQHRFKQGGIVDAIIILGNKIVPVDSKFPLDQFRRLSKNGEPTTDPRERRAFIREVKKRIDEIADKYILPDEGTFDFALMYIPAENVYYETIIKDEHGEELYPYAIERRVIPVSPNSFYAYLQVIIHGLQGMHIEERARDIMSHLARLKNDEQLLRREFDTLGSHLKNARNKYDETERYLNRFEDKLLSVSSASNIDELPPGEVKDKL